MQRNARIALAALIAVSSGIFSSTIYGRKKSGSDSAPAAPQLTGDLKAIHALNRLTFGARSQDLDALNRDGLDKWIEAQLYPESVAENPVLEAKLAPLDTLRMSSAELIHRFPTPRIIKAIAGRRLPLPSDPEIRGEIQKRVEQARRKQTGNTGAGDADAQDSHDIESLSLDEKQKEGLESKDPAEQVAVLESLPAAKQNDALNAIPRGQLRRLYAAAPPDMRRKIQVMSNPNQVAYQDLAESRLLRAVYGNRQLEEVLTDFWYNHFNVYIDKGADRYLVTSYERDVIRPHVLGKFEDLLLATAESPAMLFYLDNWQSVGPDTRPRPRAPAVRKQGLNENYARELMELHTLGVDGGYTQKDVTEVARCFTGWTIRQPRLGGAFEFNARQHDNGEKRVLGVKIPAGGGMSDGLKVIAILTHSPATAHFISKSLAIRFVSDDPPEALVNLMARRFTETNGDLREVMRAMIYSPEFWNPSNLRSKVKSPLETLASALRATDADIDFANSLVTLMNQLGEPLYRKLEPTGYSNRGADWLNSASMLARMNFAISLTQGKVAGVKVDRAQFAGEPVDLEKRLLLQEPSAGVKQSIAAALSGPDAPLQAGPMIAGLTLGSPDFQRK
jgi:uncharacterized protein (DUF1800 family)